MNQTLPTCAQCSTSFWPNGRLNPDTETHLCDGCEPQQAEVALSSDPTFDSPSFQARPARASIEVILKTPTARPSGPRVPIQPRELPGVAPAKRKIQPTPTPALPQTLAFNCPACMAVLNIARDLAIAGTTAPCPHCASMIIPPRIAPAAALKPVQRSHWRPEHS
ncbi:MAG: hypothetical protein ACI9MB_003578 [Verrucomicrobiales bacterium]|jgi:hypothetical protein